MVNTKNDKTSQRQERVCQAHLLLLLTRQKKMKKGTPMPSYQG